MKHWNVIAFLQLLVDRNTRLGRAERIASPFWVRATIPPISQNILLATLGLLLVSCNSNVATAPSPQTPATEIQLPLSRQGDLKDLPDGNYWLCTKPPSAQSSAKDAHHSWCFMSRKTRNQFIGIYSYRAPKDTAQICISGKVQGNILRGQGYEIVEGGSTPIQLTQKDLARIYGNGFWDNDSSVEKANHLRVSMPKLHSTGRYPSGNKDYYAWIQYETITLDLNGFYQYNIQDFTPPKQCPEG